MINESIGFIVFVKRYFFDFIVKTARNNDYLNRNNINIYNIQKY